MISVIVPMYNEDNISDGINRIRNVLIKADIKYEIIIIDDGSDNGLWNEICELTGKYEEITAAALSRNFGKESAICAGLDIAKGDCVVCIDADMQHPPELIPKMYELWKNGFEVVDGVKRSKGKQGICYRLCSKTFYRIFKRFSGIDLENASDFRLLDRSAVEAWKKMSEKSVFFRGMSSWIGFKRTWVYFDVEERKNGKSKWSGIALIRLALNAIVAYSSIPLYISAFMGVAVLLFCTGMFFHTLYMKLTGQAMTGFTTVILLQLILGGILMISNGVTGLYIEKIYSEVKARPRYIISRIKTKREDL